MYGYGYWWLRTKDDMTIRPELLAACAPIRRQLLAPTPTVSSPDEDVHLKVWLKEQGSASARQPGPVTSSGQQHKSPISSRKIVPLWASSKPTPLLGYGKALSTTPFYQRKSEY